MGENFNLSLPTSWQVLSDSQLAAVFRLLAQDLTSAEVKTLLLVKWNKLRILAQRGRHEFMMNPKKGKAFFVSSRQIHAATAVLDFIDTIPEMPVRISRLGRHRALHATFDGAPFEKFLFTDNLYAGFLNTRQEFLLLQMAQILYDTDKRHIPKEYLVGVFYWWSSLKQYFARLFPHFLQPVTTAQANTNLLATSNSLFDQLRESTNAQIRALTAGDITKESTVMQMDTQRALTELDAKAKEAEELKRLSKS